VRVRRRRARRRCHVAPTLPSPETAALASMVAGARHFGCRPRSRRRIESPRLFEMRDCPMLHIPILRHGKPYESIDKVTILHHATGEPVAQVSQANAGLISRDVNRWDDSV